MKKNSFTLVEILIVVALIIIISVLSLFALNPKSSIEKSQNTQRKAELSGLKKTLENWYNDHNCYPQPEEICYDEPDDGLVCHFCGTNPTSPNFSPYLNHLPCDPQTPTKEYIYQVDNLSCPRWYRIYAKLSGSTDLDQDVVLIGCTFGCGPAPAYSYNYGVSSPNIDLEKLTSSPTPTSAPVPTDSPHCPADLWCIQHNPDAGCKHCGDVNNCIINCGSPLELFSDYNCTQACQP